MRLLRVRDALVMASHPEITALVFGWFTLFGFLFTFIQFMDYSRAAGMREEQQ